MFSVKFDISKVDKLCGKLKKDLQSVKGARAGILKDKAYENGFSLIQNALVQEYGCSIRVTPKMRAWFKYQGCPLKRTTTEIIIPPRPFLRKTLKNQKQWVKYVNEMFDANQDGGMTLKQIASRIGAMMQKGIQESIGSNIPPANSGFTIKRKKSTRTLVDTGALIGSIHYEVIKNDRA